MDDAQTMPLHLLRIFQGQIRDQCVAALIAAEQAQMALNSANEISSDELHNRFWSSIQACLTAVANVSKALWGNHSERAATREPLRASLGGLSDDNILRERMMRNNFEHIDERIDRWWKSSTDHNYADKLIGPSNMIVGLKDDDMFRQFDTSTGELVFWGDRYPLAAIVNEIQRLLPLAAAEAAKPHWEA